LLRCDDPSLANRVDTQADAMSAPADPRAVLDAFRETHEELIAEPGDEPNAKGAGA
jgi:hypothetical protein